MNKLVSKIYSRAVDAGFKKSALYIFDIFLIAAIAYLVTSIPILASIIADKELPWWFNRSFDLFCLIALSRLVGFWKAIVGLYVHLAFYIVFFGLVLQNNL